MRVLPFNGSGSTVEKQKASHGIKGSWEGVSAGTIEPWSPNGDSGAMDGGGTAPPRDGPTWLRARIAAGRTLGLAR